MLRRLIAAKDRDLSSMADMVRMLHMSAEQFQAVTNTDVEAGQQLRAVAVVTWLPGAKQCGPLRAAAGRGSRLYS